MGSPRGNKGVEDQAQDVWISKSPSMCQVGKGAQGKTYPTKRTPFPFLWLQVWQGLDVVKTTRGMIGETNPADSKPGTIRGDFSIDVGK